MNETLGLRVLTVKGTFETHDRPLLGDGAKARPNPHHGQPYETISVQDLMHAERSSVAKADARWILCSTYNGHDGRHHKVQEKKGGFALLAIDVDTGNLPLQTVREAVQSFVGPSMLRIYASSSATEDNKKWRALIPLASAIKHDEWLALTTALYRHFEQHTGTRPDYSLARAGQPIYLPNTAPRSDTNTPCLQDEFVDGPPFDWSTTDTAKAAVEHVKVEADAHAIAMQNRQAEARRRLSVMRAKPDLDKSVIQQCCDAHDLQTTFAACGYTPGPHDTWRSPLQTTTSHATKAFDEPAGQYWISLSGSDFESGIGNQAGDGRSCFGDAFDVWCYFLHHNDRKRAVKAAAQLLGIKPPETAADRLSAMLRRSQATAASTPAQAPVQAQMPTTANSPNKPPLALNGASACSSIEHSPTSPPAPAQAHINGTGYGAAATANDDEFGPAFTTPAIEQLLTKIQAQAAASAPAPAPAPATIDDEFSQAITAEVGLAARGHQEKRVVPYVKASTLPPWVKPQELVERLLLVKALSVIYGDSNTGKSFFALWLAIHISLGLEWFGRRVRRGHVLYVAAESPRSIEDRARAMATRLGRELTGLYITQSTVDLFNPNGDVMALVNTIREIERITGEKLVYLVIDTLARVMGSGDENTAQDMGVLVRHCDLIRDLCGVHITLVHHTGKDQSKGARGSSALRAATDTEMAVHDPGQGKPRECSVTKQRDFSSKGEVLAFHLEPVPLGIGIFDNLITTCVVVEAQPSPPDVLADLKEGELQILDLLKDAPLGCLRYPQFIEGLSVSPATVKRYLAKLKKLQVIAEHRGVYRVLVNTGGAEQRAAEF